MHKYLISNNMIAFSYLWMKFCMWYFKIFSSNTFNTLNHDNYLSECNQVHFIHSNWSINPTLSHNGVPAHRFTLNINFDDSVRFRSFKWIFWAIICLHSLENLKVTTNSLFPLLSSFICFFLDVILLLLDRFLHMKTRNIQLK